MAEVVKMPKMSDTMTEGVMAKWHKKVGDKVKSAMYWPRLKLIKPPWILNRTRMAPYYI